MVLDYIERIRREGERLTSDEQRKVEMKTESDRLRREAFIREMTSNRGIVERVLRGSGVSRAFEDIASEIIRKKTYKKACTLYGDTFYSRMGANLVWGNVFDVETSYYPWMTVIPERKLLTGLYDTRGEYDILDYYCVRADVDYVTRDVYITILEDTVEGKRHKITFSQWTSNKDLVLKTVASAFLNPIHIQSRTLVKEYPVGLSNEPYSGPQ